jgi:hypothetical protein
VSPSGAGDAQIFLDAGTKTAARDAERIVLDVLDQHGIAAESALHRWHPIEEQWENPDVPVPQTEAERQAEHQRLEDTETAESLATGKAQWHVRVLDQAEERGPGRHQRPACLLLGQPVQAMVEIAGGARRGTPRTVSIQG